MDNIELIEHLALRRKVSSFRQHLLLCTAGKCASAKQADQSWDYLKRRVGELKLIDVDSGVYRSKVDCLRICHLGPIMLSYPDGSWYHSCTPEVIERILQEHVMGGKPVKELIFAKTNLLS